jgi:RNA polymerase sigma factor (sigma-70 family)
MCFGSGDAVPDQLAEVRRTARDARLAATAHANAPSAPDIGVKAPPTVQRVRATRPPVIPKQSTHSLPVRATKPAAFRPRSSDLGNPSTEPDCYHRRHRRRRHDPALQQRRSREVLSSRRCLGAYVSHDPPLEIGERIVAQGRWLRLLLMHLTGPQVRARVELEDLSQEVYVRAIAHADQLPPEEPADLPLRRFLARLARSVVVDAVRAIRARKRSGGGREFRLSRSDWSRTGLLESLVAGTGPGPSTEAAQWEEQARLLAAFEHLTPEHRRVLGLRQFEGVSAAETGRRMGRSEDAVNSLYRRAIEAWGRVLRREDGPS